MNKKLLKLSIVLPMLLICALTAIGQNPTYRMEIKNDVQISPNEYMLDIYIKNIPIGTWTDYFELGTLQMGIRMNAAALNGGTITPTIEAGFSDFLLAQQPTTAHLFMAGTGATYGLKLTTMLPPGAGAGTHILNTEMRVCRIKLTNSVPFVGGAKLNFTWNAAGLPWTTGVGAYVPALVNITVPASHLLTNYQNPYLNSWNGFVDNIWSNAANWSPAIVPLSTTNVFIPTGTNAQVTSDPATPATCNDLTVSTGGTLTINAAKALTASGNTTIDGSFTIKSDATGTGSFINIGTITGNATVEKYLVDGRWWYIGSPVGASTGVAAFGALSSVASTGTRLLFRNEVAQSYIPVVDADVLTPLLGYSFRTYGAPNITANFTGALNSGTYGSANNLTRTGAVAFAGFNLMANPFPSAIDFSSTALGLTRTNMDPTIWFKQSVTFATFNYASDIGANGAVNGDIPAMQAFWVRVSNGNTLGTLTITNAARKHSTNASYKTSSQENVFRLTVTSNNITDETVIAFIDDAVETFDIYDSEKMFSDVSSTPQIYSLTTDNIVTIINGFPELENNEIRVVPIGFKTNVAGTFTFDATNLDEFEESIAVSLEDITTGTMQDLRQNASYTFNSGVVNTANRFRLHFGSMTTGITENTNTSVAIYAYGNTMYVNTPQVNSIIDVYDMVGNKVLSLMSKSGMNTIQAELKSGMYLVKVQDNNGLANAEKVVINN